MGVMGVMSMVEVWVDRWIVASSCMFFAQKTR